jgi:hypothetical protein
MLLQDGRSIVLCSMRRFFERDPVPVEQAPQLPEKTRTTAVQVKIASLRTLHLGGTMAVACGRARSRFLP